MTSSELITAHHLARKAVIYIRQSTPQQVLTNQESLHLQYALRQQALALGWRDEDIEVIDVEVDEPVVSLVTAEVLDVEVAARPDGGCGAEERGVRNSLAEKVVGAA